MWQGHFSDGLHFQTHYQTVLTVTHIRRRKRPPGAVDSTASPQCGTQQLEGGPK